MGRQRHERLEESDPLSACAASQLIHHRITARLPGAVLIAHRSAIFLTQASRHRSKSPLARSGVGEASSLLERRVFVRKLTLKLVTTASIFAAAGAVVGGPLAVVPAGAAAPRSHRPACWFPYRQPRRRDSRKLSTPPLPRRTPASPDARMARRRDSRARQEPWGLLSEVLYCESVTDASNLLEGAKSNGTAQAGLKPPKGLGSTAVERVGTGSSYLIAWRARCGIRTDRAVDGPFGECDEYHHGDSGSAYRAQPASAGTRSDTTEREVPAGNSVLGDQGIAGQCEGADNGKRGFGGCWLSEESHHSVEEDQVDQRTGDDHRSHQGLCRER